MGMHESRGRLARALDELMTRWRDTSAVWDDVRGRAFEQKYMDLLEHDVRDAAAAMGQIAPLLQQIRRDCQ